jgi:ubiquinone/menaquinone biosynthesis C-methylase UbiE
MRWLFWLLYHPFAWAYDWVAWLVSAGRWQEWVQTVIPYVSARHVLEIGFGPGHLQRWLRQLGKDVWGIDESRAMVRLARRRLLRAGISEDSLHLVQGCAEALPFAPACMDCVVATFPGDYILMQETLAGVWRVLVPGGWFVVLMAVAPGGGNPLLRLLRRLLQGSSQQGVSPDLRERILERMNASGFAAKWQISDYNQDRVWFLLAQKPERSKT